MFQTHSASRNSGKMTTNCQYDIRGLAPVMVIILWSVYILVYILHKYESSEIILRK